jgi:hypothetical protein
MNESNANQSLHEDFTSHNMITVAAWEVIRDQPCSARAADEPAKALQRAIEMEKES